MVFGFILLSMSGTIIPANPPRIACMATNPYRKKISGHVQFRNMLKDQYSMKSPGIMYIAPVIP